MQVPAKIPQIPPHSIRTANKTKMPQPPATIATQAKPAVRNSPTLPALPTHSVSTPKMAKNEAQLPHSYVMVIASYENVARNGELPQEAAEQLGTTIEHRLNELNQTARQQIQNLPEYKNLKIDTLENLGATISEKLTEQEESMQAFALLKNPVFVSLMEPTEKVHRSFAEMMQDHGDAELFFGALETVSLMNQLKTSASGVNLKV